MCVAIPGIVKEINGRTAKVDFSGNLVEARTGLVEIEVGDQVLVHAGCIMQKLSKKEAEDLTSIFNELGEMI